MIFVLTRSPEYEASLWDIARVLTGALHQTSSEWNDWNFTIFTIEPITS